MSVAFSVTQRLTPSGYDPKLWNLNILATQAGDGSGGVVTSTVNPQGLDPNDIVILDHAQIYQTNATTDAAYITIESGNWQNYAVGSNGISLPVFVVPSGQWAEANSTFWSQIGNFRSPAGGLPMVLGNPLTLTPNIVFWHSPNTNSKNYYQWIHFKVIRLK